MSLDELSVRTFTATDRRKVIRVTVDGANLLRDVDLDPRSAQVIQPQTLSREIVAVWRSACQEANEVVRDAYEAAGLDAERVELAVHGLPTAGAREELASASFRGTAARGQVTVELDHRGDLLALDISSRHATETESAQLASEILDAFEVARSALAQRLEEIRARLTDGRSLEESLNERVTDFRRRIDELVQRLPAGRAS